MAERALIVSLARSNATNSGLVFGVPSPHLLVGPRPLERVGIQPVVLRPGVLHVVDELSTAGPRSPLPIAVGEGVEQQFRLVEPRGLPRCETASPPATASGQVLLCRRSGVA